MKKKKICLMITVVAIIALLLSYIISYANSNETIYVNVKGRAIFSTKQENKDLLEKNTIAIMFPYIRSYISSITTQPGMTPIVLPAMNIVAMINDQKTEEKS